jgi:hypothetical protein
MIKRLVTLALLAPALAFQMAQAPPFVWRKIENTSFQINEVLKYRIHYGWINAGTMTLTVVDKGDLVRNRPCYYARCEGKTNSAVGLAYKVDDRFESLIDKESMAPLRYQKIVKENSYTDKDNAEYFPDASKMKTPLGEMAAPSYTQDIASVFYYFRNVDFTGATPGKIYPVDIYLDQKIYNLSFKYIGKETISTGLGKIRCIKVKPKLVVDRVFKNTDGMTMWVSDDLNHIPIRIQSEIQVGSVKADLTSHYGLKNSFDSKSK